MLAKLSDLKIRLDIESSGEDELLTGVLKGTGALIDGYLDRVLEYVAADQTETYTAAVWGGLEIRLRRWPVTHVVSVKEAEDYDFAAATALTENEQFRVVRGRGRVLRLPPGTRWLEWDDAVQAVYRGGYADPISAPPSGVETMPQKFQEAALIQAVYLYRRRDQLGGGVIGMSGPNTAHYEAAVLLPVVKDLLAGERRP